MTKTALSAAIFAVIFTPQVISNTKLETITVTANRTPVAISSSLATQAVITAEDIELLQPESLLDLLTTIAGVDVSSTGGRGQNASLFLRGANASHTLVMVDGIKISSATLGLTDLPKLSVSNIERIEIVKGPRASIWGSDAMSGVIQIFTKQNAAPKLSVTVGSQSFKSLGFETSIKHGEGSTSILFDHEESEGFDVLTSAESDLDGYDYQSLAIRGQQQIDPNLSFNWLLNIDKGNSEYDNAWAGADEATHTNRQLLLGGEYKWQDNHSYFSLSQFKDDSTNFRSDSPGLFDSKITSDRQQLSAANTTTINAQASFTVGTDLVTEKVSGDQEYSKPERDISAIFAQILYNENQWQFEGSIRHDVVESLDSETTHTVALGYKFDANNRLSMTQGTGFKVPTFNDLYWPTDAYSMGNPELQAERSDNIEIKFEQSLDIVEWQISAYKNKISNLIEWQPDANFVYAPQNVANAELKGIELTVSANYKSFNHQLTSSWAKPLNLADDSILPLRAKRMASYIVSRNWNSGGSNNLNTLVEFRYVGERMQKSWDGSETKLVAHTIVNATFGYDINQRFHLSLALKDMFDQQEPTAVGYNVIGRRAYLGVDYSF